MLRFVTETVYWSLVFVACSVWAHATWPWGLLMIPASAAYIQLRKLARAKGYTGP